MKISKDELSLFLNIRNTQKNPKDLSNFFENLLMLSNSCRNEALGGEKVIRKIAKIIKVRRGINQYVNKHGVKSETIKKAVGLIVTGKIENLEIIFRDQIYNIDSLTNFYDLSKRFTRKAR